MFLSTELSSLGRSLPTCKPSYKQLLTCRHTFRHKFIPKSQLLLNTEKCKILNLGLNSLKFPTSSSGRNKM